MFSSLPPEYLLILDPAARIRRPAPKAAGIRTITLTRERGAGRFGA